LVERALQVFYDSLEVPACVVDRRSTENERRAA